MIKTKVKESPHPGAAAAFSAAEEMSVTSTSDEYDSIGKITKTLGKSKRKNKSTMSSSEGIFTTLTRGLNSFSMQMKTDPRRTASKVLVKLGFYLWSFAVVLSVLSLLGVPVSSMLPFGSGSNSLVIEKNVGKIAGPIAKEGTKGRILRASDDDQDDDDIEIDVDVFGTKKTSKTASSFPAENGGISGFWKGLSVDSILSSVPASAIILDDFETDDSKGPGDDEDAEGDAETGEEEIFENVPQQVISSAPKQGNTLNKKLEKELACEEETCNVACVRKMKPKCAKSLSCRKEREKVCKRRCRKQRCEERCKDEPKFGYVEREQRMEKCKDDCTGPTAVHNKCIKKCHSQFKPCKSRCHEIAGKFICDKPKDTAALFMSTRDDSDPDEGEDEQESDDDGEDSFTADSLFQTEDDEDDDPFSSLPEPATKPKSSAQISSASSSASINDLLDDPEMI